MRAPDGGVEHEADITINGTSLTFAQSMTVRVALGHFQMTLAGDDFARALGPVAANYKDRLGEVMQLVRRTAR
jgi:hypothetical protein